MCPISVGGKCSGMRQYIPVHAILTGSLQLQNMLSVLHPAASFDVTVMQLDERKNYRLFQVGFLVSASR